MAKRQQITDLTSTDEMVAHGGAYHANALRLNAWWRAFLAEEIAAREAKLRGRTAGRGVPEPTAETAPHRPAARPATAGGDLAWDDYVAPAAEEAGDPAASAESAPVLEESGPAVERVPTAPDTAVAAAEATGLPGAAPAETSGLQGAGAEVPSAPEAAAPPPAAVNGWQ